MEELYQQYLKGDNFEECYLLSKIFDLPDSHLSQIFQKASTNVLCQKGFEVISTYSLNIDNYPSLKERLQKLYLRKLMQKKVPWFCLEGLYQSNPEVLAFLAEDYFYNDQKEIATRLSVKYDLFGGKYLKKVEI